MNKTVHVIVIGGGAAGFFGAITCAETHPRARVTLLEKGREFLIKVRLSGGGRCNVTHACFDPAALARNYPRGGRALRGPFSRFQPRDTVAWFAARGVQLKTEPDGRMFPVTDSSETIVHCLMRAAEAAGVELRTGSGVTSVERRDAGFVMELQGGQQLTCDRVLLATGGYRQAYPWAQSLGHVVEPPVPSLFTFTVPDSRLADLSGVSVGQVQLRLAGTRLEQTGPLLITHWGLSGPAVLKLSAWGARVLRDCNYRAELLVNWLPDHSRDQVCRALLDVKAQYPRRWIGTDSPFDLPHRLWKRLVAAAEIAEQQRWADLSKPQLNRLADELVRGSFLIRGKGAFKEEFVTCGGVSLDDVNMQTMESRRCPGLYFAGEILDVDGLTGGFNFQSAWTTGWIAGQAMGKARGHSQQTSS